jgi:hypothetical protein
MKGLSRRWRWGLVSLALAVVATPAAAQVRLEARYAAKLAGITVGTGAWIVEISEDQFTAAATGRTTGLLRSIAGGEGSSAARGRITKAGLLVPSSYAATITTEKKTEELRISLQNGTIRDFSIEPAPPENPNRVPITEAHKRNVSDPMTSSLVRVGPNEEPVSEAACKNAVSVFDGRMRYDLQLHYLRTENVKAEKSGYQGPVVVCQIVFVPVAGYVPARAAIKYLAARRDMEAWFAPLAGTRILAPFKVVVPTPLGTGTLEAQQFVVSGSTKLTPTSAKTQ